MRRYRKNVPKRGKRQTKVSMPKKAPLRERISNKASQLLTRLDKQAQAFTKRNILFQTSTTDVKPPKKPTKLKKSQ